MRHSTIRRLLPLTLLGVLWLAMGCGPVQSTYLILSAQAELDGARAAQADRYAPYEYTAANQYLDKAREEQGYAEFGASVDFAYKAKELAKEGKKRSLSKQQEESPPELIESGDAPVIIKGQDTEQSPTSVKIVPVPVEEGTRPPE
jgi:hypothetical protein